MMFTCHVIGIKLKVGGSFHWLFVSVTTGAFTTIIKKFQHARALSIDASREVEWPRSQACLLSSSCL